MDDRLAPNYTEEKLELDSCIAITIIKEEEKIVSFSTILHRDMFGNAVRCVNRLYKIPLYRYRNLDHYNRIKFATFEMIQQQIQFAKDRDYDIIFMSRELKDINVKNQKSFNSTAMNRWREYLPDKNNWIYSPNMHLVTTPEHIKSNWQSILYYQLRDDIELKLKSMTLNKYRKLFIKGI
ncbi:uncharacterized protein METZ01_LOCUS482587 [marine metagenome]|uniref:Uncharacterized protein n=1 Tax=marine metagenome TaxID=408172 RepID=A0A383CCE4_9ZZZZ